MLSYLKSSLRVCQEGHVTFIGGGGADGVSLVRVTTSIVKFRTKVVSFNVKFVLVCVCSLDEGILTICALYNEVEILSPMK